MLNFQIRGYGLELCVKSIDEKTLDIILNKIRDEKCSLAKIMHKNNILKTSSIYKTLSPILTKDAELIITSINTKDYYNDGYSFFRSKIKDLVQVPINKPICVPTGKILIINKATFYGCVFEAEISNHDYRSFNSNHLAISTFTTPIYDAPLLKEVFLKNVKLNNLKRKKFDLITFQSSILAQNNFKIHKDIDSKDFIDTPEYFLDSKISFKTHYK